MTEHANRTRREFFSTVAALATVVFAGEASNPRSALAAEAAQQIAGNDNNLTDVENNKSPEISAEIGTVEFSKEVKKALLTHVEIRSSMGLPEDGKGALAAYEKRLKSLEGSEVSEVVSCLKQLVVNLGLSNVPSDIETLNKYLKELDLEEPQPKNVWDDKKLNESIRSLLLASVNMDDKHAEAAWRKVRKEFLGSVVLDHQLFHPLTKYGDLKPGGNELAKHFSIFASRRMAYGGMLMPHSESRFVHVARKCLIEKFNSSSPVPSDELWKDIMSVWCLSSIRIEIPFEVLSAIKLHPDKTKGLAMYVPAKNDVEKSSVRSALIEDLNIEGEPSLVKYFKDKDAIFKMPAGK